MIDIFKKHIKMNFNTKENKLLKSYYEVVSKYGFYKRNINNLKWYLNIIFKKINFFNKKVLDIGGGFGLYSIYAACLGAAEVIILEPSLQGSESHYESKFQKLSNCLKLSNVIFIPKPIQSFHENIKFDVILLHNSINHLDEYSCKRLHYDEKAKLKYIYLFNLINNFAEKGSFLVICDCSRYNFFRLLNIKNPIAPNIEWQKHQSPQFWANMLKNVGFANPKILWIPPKPLRSFGKILFGNKYLSYFLASYFCLTMKKE